MRFAVVVIALAGCGRLGFNSAADDAIDDSGTSDADITPANAVDVDVFYLVDAVRTPFPDATVVVESLAGTQVLATDAAGHARAVVDAAVTVHVAKHLVGVGGSDSWDIATYAEVPPGESLIVGPLADDAPPPTQGFSFGATAVSGAQFYFTVAPAECSQSVSGGMTSGAGINVYASCVGVPIPIVLRAFATNENPIAMQFALVTPGTTTDMPGPWIAPAVHEIAFPAHPQLPFEAAETWHTEGAYTVETTGNVGTAMAGVASVRVANASIDAVTISYRNAADDAYAVLHVPAPMVGNRTTIAPDRALTSLASFTRSNAKVLTWAYDTVANLRPASGVRVVEFYGNVEHEYYVDPTRLTITRPRLPAPLDTLFDGANVGKASVSIFRLGTKTFEQVRPTVSAVFRRLGRGEPDYAFDSRDSN